MADIKIANLLLAARCHALAVPSSSSSVAILMSTSSILAFAYSATAPLSGSTSIGDHRNGPRFLVEPPAKVHFLNDTGTVITCKVTGAPPVRVWWSLSDGTLVSDIHALRHVRPNGDLVISPFQPSMFRQDIHATVSIVQCSREFGDIWLTTRCICFVFVADLSVHGH